MNRKFWLNVYNVERKILIDNHCKTFNQKLKISQKSDKQLKTGCFKKKTVFHNSVISKEFFFDISASPSCDRNLSSSNTYFLQKVSMNKGNVNTKAFNKTSTPPKHNRNTDERINVWSFILQITWRKQEFFFTTRNFWVFLNVSMKSVTKIRLQPETFYARVQYVITQPTKHR